MTVHPISTDAPKHINSTIHDKDKRGWLRISIAAKSHTRTPDSPAAPLYQSRLQIGAGHTHEVLSHIPFSTVTPPAVPHSRQLERTPLAVFLLSKPIWVYGCCFTWFHVVSSMSADRRSSSECAERYRDMPSLAVALHSARSCSRQPLLFQWSLQVSWIPLRSSTPGEESQWVSKCVR